MKMILILIFPQYAPKWCTLVTLALHSAMLNTRARIINIVKRLLPGELSGLSRVLLVSGSSVLKRPPGTAVGDLLTRLHGLAIASVPTGEAH